MLKPINTVASTNIISRVLDSKLGAGEIQARQLICEKVSMQRTALLKVSDCKNLELHTSLWIPPILWVWWDKHMVGRRLLARKQVSRKTPRPRHCRVLFKHKQRKLLCSRDPVATP